MQVLKLGGATIKQPTSFTTEKYNITKAARTLDGNMKMDLIAKKLKFLFEYEVLSGTDLEAILAVIDTDEMFFVLTYTENNDTEKTATVYVGAIHAKKFRTDGVWYWTNVKFDLIEQ